MRARVWWVVGSLASGWLYGVAFPPTAWWWLAWVAFVPVIAIARGGGPKRAGAAGALLAIAATGTTVDWLPRALAGFYGQPIAVGTGLFLAILVLMVVPPFSIFGLVVWLTASAPAALRPLLVAASWTATELWRANAFTGNPWVLVGYSQVHTALVPQIADLTGVYGVTFVVMAVNAAVAELLLAAQARIPRRDALAAVRIAATTLALALGYGGMAVQRQGALATPSRAVAIVQGNLDLGVQWREEFYGRNLEDYLRLTRTALEARSTLLVLWPESAMTFFLDGQRAYQAAIGATLAPFASELVAGGPYSVVDDRTRQYRNSAFVLEPSGAIRRRYDKEVLLPFAEYFPFPSIDFMRRSFGRVREFVPGPSAPAPLVTAAGRAGILICNEAMFPEVARARVRAGAEVLLVLANDSWVGDEKFARIAFDMAVMRAIETRRFALRASTAGPSAVITPTGAVPTLAPYGVAATVAGDVAPRALMTPYTRFGDVFAYGCAAVTALATLLGFRARRARRQAV